MITASWTASHANGFLYRIVELLETADFEV